LIKNAASAFFHWGEKLIYDWVNGIFSEFALLYPWKYTVLA